MDFDFYEKSILALYSQKQESDKIRPVLFPDISFYTAGMKIKFFKDFSLKNNKKKGMFRSRTFGVK